MNAITRMSVAVILLAFPLSMPAHRLDEYLQATRLSIAENRIIVKLDLTPGVDIAPMIFALINTNRDGRISDGEGQAYSNQVLKDMVLEVDGKRLHLDFVNGQFPQFQE